MRILGYILLVFGFISLAFSAACAKKNAIMALGHHLNELPKQETFARKEVEQIIWNASFYGQVRFGDAMVPPVLMLCGGILLDRARQKQKDASHVA